MSRKSSAPLNKPRAEAPPIKLSELAISPEALKKLGVTITVNGERQALPVDKTGAVLASHKNVRVQFMDVTPERAAQWLKNNFGNRPVSEDVINAYARDILNDAFLVTHQGIAFNDKDELIDGQHFLHAVIKANKAVHRMVSFGWPSAVEGKKLTTMDCVDRGRTRSVADQLKIQHGIRGGSIIAAVSNSLANLCYGERTRRLSVDQTLRIFAEFEPGVLWTVERRSKKAGMKSAGVLAAFSFALMTEFTGDKEKPFWRERDLTPIAEMLERLNGDEPLPETTPLFHLRNFLLSEEASLLTRSLDRGLAEMVLQAIYLEQRGAQCAKATDLVSVLDGVKHFAGLQKDRADLVAGLFRLPGTKASKAVTLCKQ